MTEYYSDKKILFNTHNVCEFEWVFGSYPCLEWLNWGLDWDWGGGIWYLYIFKKKYYSVFRNFSWTNTIRYSVFVEFHERILFGIRYSDIFHERILFGIRYSEIFHERIYSVFGIRSNSLFGATLKLFGAIM